MPIPYIAAAIVGALALGGGVAATAAVVNEQNNSDEAVVVRVVDGDTVDVRMFGDVQRVRLLNINAPEDNAATGVAECMGPEASAALTKLLPKGAAVTLRYDAERYDRYDRLLAGIFLDDTLVNAEMAREGLAASMVVGDNTRFIEDVRAGETKAKETQAGIFGESIPCALGAVVETYRTQADAAVARSVPDDSARIAEVVAASTVALRGGRSARLALDSVDWVPAGLRTSYKTAVKELKVAVRDAKKSQEAAYTRAVDREEAEAARIAAEEAARIAAEQAARIAAEQEAARVAAEKAAAAQAARDAAQRQSSNTSSGGGSSASGSSSGDGGGSTYTGCRNYNGYGMLDTKGRHFAPIPCP